MPLSFDALMRAVELNGAAIEMNKTAFAWGRLAAIDPPAVLEAAGLVRNAPTVAERRRTSCRCCRRANGKATSGAPTSRRSRTRTKTNCATCPTHGGGDDVAFLPLDDARLSRSLDEVIARRVAFLTDYQNAGYAKRYADFVAKVRDAEAAAARRAAPT